MATHPAPREILLEPGGYEDIDAVMAVMDDAFPPCFGERWSRSQVSGVLPLSGVRLLLAHDGGADAPIVGATTEAISDPLPQALVLTAIVITFGVTAFLLALAYRSYVLTASDAVEDDLEDRRIAELSRKEAA